MTMKTFSELASALSNSVSNVRLQHQQKDAKESRMQYDQDIIGNRPKPVHIEAEITNFTKNGSGFARELNGPRHIFIPSTVVSRSRVRAGDIVTASTVPNRLYEEWTPDLGVMQPAQLFAIHLTILGADPVEQEAAPVVKKSLSRLILDALQDGPMRAAAIAKFIGEEKTYPVFDKLEEMHSAGEVAKSNIYARGGQKQASYVIWALHARELFPELDEDDVDDMPDLQQ